LPRFLSDFFFDNEYIAVCEARIKYGCDQRMDLADEDWIIVVSYEASRPRMAMR
jgi:hypothetical protein